MYTWNLTNEMTQFGTTTYYLVLEDDEKVLPRIVMEKNYSEKISKEDLIADIEKTIENVLTEQEEAPERMEKEKLAEDIRVIVDEGIAQMTNLITERLKI